MDVSGDVFREVSVVELLTDYFDAMETKNFDRLSTYYAMALVDLRQRPDHHRAGRHAGSDDIPCSARSSRWLTR